MGRLAGQSIASQRSKSWKEKVAETREEKARYAGVPAPLHAPGAARRRMALLWLIGGNSSNVFGVGGRDEPPLTADMWFLLDKGHVKLTRESSGMLTSPMRRWNRLSITPAGKLALAAARVTEVERAYITAARINGMLR